MTDIPSHQEQLLGLVREYLDRQRSFDDFADRYWEYYLRRVPPGALSERDEAFFDAIHERTERVALAPDDEERCEQGYMTPEEFREWLAERMNEYDAGEELDLEWW